MGLTGLGGWVTAGQAAWWDTGGVLRRLETHSGFTRVLQHVSLPGVGTGGGELAPVKYWLILAEAGVFIHSARTRTDHCGSFVRIWGHEGSGKKNIRGSRVQVYAANKTQSPITSQQLIYRMSSDFFLLVNEVTVIFTV